MSEINPPSPLESTYVMDAENAAEIARLFLQGRALISTMGSLFPASIAPASIHNVLDLASEELLGLWWYLASWGQKP